MPYIVKIGYSEFLADDHKRAMEVVDAVAKLYKVKSTHLNDDNDYDTIYGTDHEGVEVGILSINGYTTVKEMHRLRKEHDEKQKMLKEKKELEEAHANEKECAE